jgi:hypothetical protein
MKTISWHAIEHAWMAPCCLFCTSAFPGRCKNESCNERGRNKWSTGAGVNVIVSTFAQSIWVQVFMLLAVGSCWAVLFLLAFVTANPGLLVVAIAVVRGFREVKKTA